MSDRMRERHERDSDDLLPGWYAMTGRDVSHVVWDRRMARNRKGWARYESHCGAMLTNSINRVTSYARRCQNCAMSPLGDHPVLGAAS